MTWLLVLWLVLPGGGVTRETLNGFGTKSDCVDYGLRYKHIEFRWESSSYAKRTRSIAQRDG